MYRKLRKDPALRNFDVRVGPISHLERLESLVPDVHQRPLRVPDALDTDDEAGKEDEG